MRKRRRIEPPPPPLDEEVPPEWRDDADRGVGLIGAAEGAPLSQGRDGSLPVEFDGVDIAVPEVPERIRGEPVEPALHAPTTDHVEPLPVATGECTVEVVEGESPCREEEEV